MKKAMRILALILCVWMLATALAACSGKKDSDKSGASSETATEAATEAPKGEIKTSGEITVFVPAEFELREGNFVDPDDERSVCLIYKEDETNYIDITVYDTESAAANIVEDCRKANEDNWPADAMFERNGVTWTGFTMDMSATRVFNIYGTIGDKSYYITSAGYGKKFKITEDDNYLFAVIDSLG